MGRYNAIADFNIVETTIEDIHAAFKAGRLTARQLVQMYLDRIAAYDQKGPAINAIISLNPDALSEAERLDAAFESGFVGPLHGIPLIMKDQADQGHAYDARIYLVQGLQAKSGLFCRRQTQGGWGDFPWQGHARRARRGRHARLVVRVE